MSTLTEERTGDHHFPPIVEEMADLLAKHKLVPFVGAGISRQHLGVAAAELAAEMAQATGCAPETALSDVADDYVSKRGEDAFVGYLRRKLVVADLDERRAPSHRLLVSLMQNLIYTTNQDNIFELTASKYGRHYRRVVTVADLSEAIPGEPLLIKFHGDTDVPSSLVFGTKSYQERMQTEDHPLDIKLRADLLGKRLLFLGYSLRDENVAKLFATVKRAHGGTLPSSYLVAFDDDPLLMESAQEYQVKVVVPRRVFPEMEDNAQAFERFLQLLCDATRTRQVELGTSDIFAFGTINPRIVTDYEVRAVTAAVRNEPFDIALDSFRVTFDQTHVPEYLQPDVTDLFVCLVERADPQNSVQMSALSAALFNFRLPPASALKATAAVMAACNKRPTTKGFDDFGALICPALPKGTMPVAAACAVAMLGDRGEIVTDNFRRHASWWFRGYESVEGRSKELVISMIKVAWPGTLEHQSPLHQSFASLGIVKDFHEIVREMTGMLPKRVESPKE
ncbi:SIR2 family protein [Burkholderia glumae]|uniref:SIR2 family NAD-dependent protein deacylase n=1 Tax=Burkholderia glumae TaxID=337 RepID=UPI00148E9ED0|nr:SIR2 family protein [Burkholderia glumae]MCQ0034407.1 SIR2 family protein [Burkholderia glumae]MCQ0039501.1 SIR2 family protein [Burkholderia glumae]QJW79089.1 SIR2 family protein [Burkholderia glumae]UVS85922.1 SIR2 family protein [Burkholderia glumae]